ncbi:MAG: FecR family protein [Parabacteroides gordonii]|jgi:transmembrane sensor|uniref:FecR family protein n=1 Tax=Parabacteroides gordonii TaxID=574930 RepID=UPI0026F28E64|nr:FecR family protein [Parabacteroides gordonii]
MSYIKKIVDYFFHHDFSEETIRKVHQRLTKEDDRPEVDDALLSVWDTMGFPEMNENHSEQAFSQLSRQLGFSEQKEPVRKSLRPTSFVMKLAAIWLLPLIMLSSSVYFYWQANIAKDAVADVLLIEHFVPAGKREQIILPDSSRVWLNSGSVLIYPSTFIGQTRDVYLSGEGYFEVEKNTEQPFIVKARTLNVEVLGTRFNILAYPEVKQIATTLEEGSVRVCLQDNDKKVYHLVPDEQLVYNIDSGIADIKQVVSADYSDWREGGLLFDNYSFSDIIRILQRTYGVNVHLQTSVYNNNKITVHFNKNESLENIFMLLKELIPGLEYRIENKDIFLK